jgi:hypothetical protein
MGNPFESDNDFIDTADIDWKIPSKEPEVAVVSGRPKDEDEVTRLIKKWSGLGHLDGVKLDFLGERALAIILENVSLTYDTSYQHTFLTPEQAVWLAREGWVRSKLRHYVGVQAMIGASSLVYFFDKKGNLQEDSVIATTSKTTFSIFRNADFESVKELYADSLAREIDQQIFWRLPRVNPNVLLGAIDGPLSDISHSFNYVVGDKTFIGKLKDHPAAKWAKLHEADPILDPDSFDLVVAAGKIPSSIRDFMSGLIMCPYVLVSEAPPKVGQTHLFLRMGWHLPEPVKVRDPVLEGR